MIKGRPGLSLVTRDTKNRELKRSMPHNRFFYRQEGHVGIVSLCEPLETGAKIIEIGFELLGLCDKINSDKETRVIVIEGLGHGSFSGDNDLVKSTSKFNHTKLEELISISDPIAKLDRPVIAAIRGNAIGIGLEVVLACDIRIATNTSKFGLPHLREGLIPWDGGTQRLSRIVGKAKAMEIILTGDMVDAQEALRIGLVNRIIEPDKCSKTVLKMAHEMASKAPIALRYAKEAINGGMDLTLEQGLHLEADLYYLIQTTRDRTEGIGAFQDKRKPQFKGS